jgi:hypothetical protein
MKCCHDGFEVRVIALLDQAPDSHVTLNKLV